MQHRVLLLEDEPAIADNLIYALRNEGFVVQHVGLARDALSAFAQDGADVVVLDIGVPDGNGLDVYRQLRQHNAVVPVMFLTARAAEIDRIIGLELGADDYVTKPFSPREVCARIRTILRRSQASAAPPNTGLWRLDEADQLVRYAEQALPLTRYEFLLLATLLRRPGRIFDRPALMQLVWSDAPDTAERTVDAHIKLLRAKLRQAGADPAVIHTHRHMGYSFQG